jgi:ribosome recycling factor
MPTTVPKFEAAAAAVDQHLQKELASVRAGRATASLLDDVRVEAYGVRVPLQQLASVSVPEPRQLVVTPFDPSTAKDIERALQAADLGLSIAVEGKTLRLSVPPLTEERRKDLVKTVKQKLEASRVQLRQARDAQREATIASERAGEMGEDEKFNQLKEVDERTKHWQDKLGEIAEAKEAEIMKV